MMGECEMSPNNSISCRCRDCGNCFVLPVPWLLEQDQELMVRDAYWCGKCQSKDYEWAWGIVAEGTSEATIEEVLSAWNRWAAAWAERVTKYRS